MPAAAGVRQTDRGDVVRDEQRRGADAVHRRPDGIDQLVRLAGRQAGAGRVVGSS